nr:hypothetical protein Iba_chr10eCG15510 [Ipomoea batatas]
MDQVSQTLTMFKLSNCPRSSCLVDEIFAAHLRIVVLLKPSASKVHRVLAHEDVPDPVAPYDEELILCCQFGAHELGLCAHRFVISRHLNSFASAAENGSTIASIRHDQRTEFTFKTTATNLPTTRAAKAVVPEARSSSKVQASARAVSVCRNAEETALSISLGKSSSSAINLGRWEHAKSAACFPP